MWLLSRGGGKNSKHKPTSEKNMNQNFFNLRVESRKANQKISVEIKIVYHYLPNDSSNHSPPAPSIP